MKRVLILNLITVIIDLLKEVIPGHFLDFNSMKLK